MVGWRDDFRWALRYVRRRPVPALSITLTLTIAIAAATTAFGLASAVLWRPLPFRDASRLVFVWEFDPNGERAPMRVTGARHAAWRDTASGLSSISQFGATGFTVESGDGAASIRGVRVSANYFETLGIQPIVGRTFAPADEEPGNHRVVILSHGLWQERFSGRRDVVGETLRLTGQAYTIVGVMPPETLPGWALNPAVVTIDADSRQLWVPIPHTPDLDRSDRAHVFGVVARLAPGVDAREASDRLNRSSAASADRHQSYVQPFREQFVATARAPLLALTGAAIAVLLIACTNLAAFYVSAFEARRAEFAVRVAIGAGATRLIRQLALEAWLVSSAGAAGGLAIARVALANMPRWLPPSIPFLTLPRVDISVVGFGVALATIAGVVLTGWPIVRLILAAPAPRGAVLPSGNRVYRALVVSQVAVTVALVAVASLLTQSLQSVERQDTGFAIDHVLIASIGLPYTPSPNPLAIARTEQAILDSIRIRPSARSVAVAYDHPLEANWSESLALVGDMTAEEERRQVELRIVSPGYFEALDVELLDGRTLGERDTFDAPGVAVVNEAFARTFPGTLLGRRLRSSPPRFQYGSAAAAEFAIVGIVRNERFRGLEQPAAPAYYLSTRQFPQSALTLLVRTHGDPLAAALEVRSAVRAADAGTTFTHATSLEHILGEQLARRRVTTTVISGFATAALTLAALGMYGLLAMQVGSRRREIGVRLAIGAPAAAVAQTIIGESLRNALAGIAIGGVLAMTAGSLVQSLLVGVSARDPRTVGTVAVVLFAVAILAAVAPARRAARIDPAEALRAD
jgi:putative ABC transport system permease protein